MRCRLLLALVLALAAIVAGCKPQPAAPAPEPAVEAAPVVPASTPANQPRASAEPAAEQSLAVVAPELLAPQPSPVPARPSLVDPVAVAAVRIPSASLRYRQQIDRAVADNFGVSGSPARLAAKLHAESAWNGDAASPYAQGLAQFTPATAKWLPSVCPEVGSPDPWDEAWSIRAAACYDEWLYQRVSGATECDRWAKTESAYNGGLGWIARDERLAASHGVDPLVWFGGVELHTARAAWARKENRAYPRKILLVLEPAYIAAGWEGAAVCQ